MVEIWRPFDTTFAQIVLDMIMTFSKHLLMCHHGFARGNCVHQVWQSHAFCIFLATSSCYHHSIIASLNERMNKATYHILIKYCL